MSATIERPTCDCCGKRPADITEASVNFCSGCYSAYKNLKVKEVK